MQKENIVLSLTSEEQAFLSRIAVLSIEHGLAEGKRLDDAAVERPQEPALLGGCGAFVTLTRSGRLRGCIGNIVGNGPLYLTVGRMAYASAFGDPRFPPLKAAEWPDTAMEISVLSEPRVCPDPEQIEIGRHGLVLRQGSRTGVFLPQVPVEQGWSRMAYLEALCEKAGLPRGSWHNPTAQLLWFEAFVFSGKQGT